MSARLGFILPLMMSVSRPEAKEPSCLYGSHRPAAFCCAATKLLAAFLPALFAFLPVIVSTNCFAGFASKLKPPVATAPIAFFNQLMCYLISAHTNENDRPDASSIL